MIETSQITVHDINREKDVTFRATIYDEGTAINVEGPVDIIVNQIQVNPSDDISNCGVALTYPRNNKYNSCLAGMIVISPEDEKELVEWLHSNGANYYMEDSEFQASSLQEASIRGKCSGCETYFSSKSEWEITCHVNDRFDRHFCSKECFEKSV